jgi:predicted transcriptional regulator
MRKNGMEPGDIARVLELSPDTVSRYLEPKLAGVEG